MILIRADANEQIGKMLEKGWITQAQVDEAVKKAAGE